MRFLELAAKGQRDINWDGIRDVPMPGCMVRDLTDLPIKGIADNTYTGIYSEHFIEHITKEEGIALFKECLRILKPGGCLRTVWPPMDYVNFLRNGKDHSDNEFVKHYYEIYIKKHRFAGEGHDQKPIQEQVAIGLLHQKGEHKYLWGVQEMFVELMSAGFTKLGDPLYNNSRVAAFRNIDTPGSIREAHSAVVEAQKPWR
jgi:hypothetical protein